jgi:hypothetical protein
VKLLAPKLPEQIPKKGNGKDAEDSEAPEVSDRE